MTELEKIAYAKSFIDKLAQGINPIDETPIPENDIANNVRLSRCFFYVSDILRQVIDNGGINPTKPSKTSKSKFVLSEEERARITLSETPLRISDIADYLNTIVDEGSKKKISASSINTWLVEVGLLEKVELANGKHRKLPTELGNEMGIHTENRSGQYGEYTVVLFDSEAQAFIYDNIEAIAESKHQKNNPEFKGKAWTAEQDEMLIELFKVGTPIPEISKNLKRTRGGVRARLKKFGLINDEIGETLGSSDLRANEEHISSVPKERTISIINGKIYTPDMDEYEAVLKQAKNSIDDVPNSALVHTESSKEKIFCSDCYYSRSGECSSWEPCEYYRPAVNLSKSDTDYWPTEGDATFIKQKGHKRYD